MTTFNDPMNIHNGEQFRDLSVWQFCDLAVPNSLTTCRSNINNLHKLKISTQAKARIKCFFKCVVGDPDAV